MNPAQRVHEAWLEATADFGSTPFLAAIARESFTIDHYAMFLRELFHNTRENPEGLAHMAGLLKGDARRLNQKILRHAYRESGHDRMALSDLGQLGYDPARAESGRALWTTEAFTAFSIFQLERRHPLAYLGYIYHLEKAAVTWGPRLLDYFRSLGIPPEAMTFLREHSEADIGHARLNQEYIRELVTNEADLEAVIYGLRGTVRLHALMLQGVIDAVEQAWPEWRSLQDAYRGAAVPAHQS